MVDWQLAANIRRARKKRKLTQVHLSMLIDATDQHLSDLERGEGIPSLRMLGRIAMALEIAPAALLKGVTPEELMFTVKKR